MQNWKRTLSLLEANRESGVGQHTIRAAIANGKLRAIKIGSRRIRIRPEALEQWLKNLEQGNAT
jgi:excisionase family DNA binding protein